MRRLNVKSKQNEEFVYEGVKSGEFEIDKIGQVWRVMVRRGNRWNKKTRLNKCKRRRAEHDMGLYYQVRLMRNRVRVACMAHRLVWRHVNGPIPLELTINHKNGIKKDNRPENLELATYSQQIVHAIDVLGQHQWMRKQSGEKNHMAKLTPDAVQEIISLREQILSEMKTRHGRLISTLAKKYGVSYQCVWDVVRGRRWDCHGA